MSALSPTIRSDSPPTLIRLSVRFQQDRGIVIDGIVGPATFRQLEEARWNLGDRVVSYSPGT